MKAVLSSLVQCDSIPRRALPQLLKLLDNPEQRTDKDTRDTLDVTTRYPIREKAVQCLRKLNIECETEKELVEEGMVPLDGDDMGVKARKFHVRTTVDDRSVVDTIRQWLLSSEKHIWRAGIEVVSQMNRGDVNEMFQELIQNGRLSREKINYFQRVHSSSDSN